MHLIIREKEEKNMTRNDLILIAVLITFSLVPLVPGSQFLIPNHAVIKIDGAIVRKIDLTADETFTLEAGGGKNVIEIKDGAVSVIAADCPDKICVRRGAIKNTGETIACVPHKVLIEIAGD